MSDYRVSFQLYTARNFPPLESQLEVLAALGYDAVEPFLEAYQNDPAAFRSLADAHGLPVPSVLTKLAWMDEDPDRAIAAAQVLGAGTLVLPYLFPDERPADRAGWIALATRIAGHARRAADAGVDLAWHNHDFEYAVLADGSRPIELLLADEFVGWEPDVAWLARAGCRIGKELRRHREKIRVVHMKDTAPMGIEVEGGWADVGSGTIDWADVWPEIRASDATVLVVEHDDPADWKRAAANSLRFIRQLSMRSGN